MTVKPDLDKVCRAAIDALEAGGALTNDAQVTTIWATKAYREEEAVSIEMRAVD